MTRSRLLVALVAAITCSVVTPLAADDLMNSASDTYSEMTDDGRKDVYLQALTAAGESATGKLVSFHVSGANDTILPGGQIDLSKQVYVHALQDRGVPRGTEYPTYVFRTVGKPDDLVLIYKTFAGTRIYMSEVIGDEPICLISAKKGYSDVCLADIYGNPAPNLTGLRDDFWSDMMKLLGF